MTNETHFCRSCSHATTLVDDGCRHCGSTQVGLHTFVGRVFSDPPFAPVRQDRESYPDVYEQIHYHIKFRLLKGFAILRMTGDM